MNSKQGSRYIKRRMGNDLKQKILEYNGVISPEVSKRKPSILNCPRCYLVNAIENKYCTKCSYPLAPSAFDELKMEENVKFEKLENKYEKMNSTLQAIFSIIQNIDRQGKRKCFVFSRS
jgi:ribosomal protein L40E